MSNIPRRLSISSRRQCDKCRKRAVIIFPAMEWESMAGGTNHLPEELFCDIHYTEQCQKYGAYK